LWYTSCCCLSSTSPCSTPPQVRIGI
jgi:hypothetical protein